MTDSPRPHETGLPSAIKGMILAAGFGTRLRPVTFTLPKPIVPLCNRPLIAWAIESFLAAGVRDLIVNLHHLPEPIERYLRAAYPRLNIELSFEHEILGTGGAIRRVRALLGNTEAFCLVNGDTVQFPRWGALHAALGSSIAALTLRHPPANDRFTPVYYADGLVRGFGKGAGEPLMFAGSHLIRSSIFPYLPEEEEFGIVDRVYQPLLDAATETLAGVVDDGLWFDIGTPERYASASSALLNAMVAGELAPPAASRIVGDSLLHESARGTVVRSVVGAGSSVTGEARDSVVWDDCIIEGSLDHCLVAHGAHVRGDYRDVLIVPDHPAIPGDYERTEGLVVVDMEG